MYFTLLLLPLLSTISSGFFSRKIGYKGAQLWSCICLILTTILVLLLFYKNVLNNEVVILNILPWLNIEFLNVEWELIFDSLTLTMLIPVVIVSTLVHLYSVGYMSGDPHQSRFFSYLSMFTFFMILLVTSNNYFVFFAAWECVGVTSYLLVGFWYTIIQANKSAINAILVNKVGDWGLTLAMFSILWSVGNLDFETLFSLVPYINLHIVIIGGFFLILAAMAKSAQLGLHIWLPFAMAAPTPVSALLHSATMVTAGCFLLLRSSSFIEYSDTLMLSILWLGALTAIFAACTGLFQHDIKKIIAYSTCSQLGMLFISIGLSQYNLALFHLFNHAYLKSLLFLGAGAIIHSMNDQQDIRKYGGLIRFLPFSYSVLLIGSLSLMALPYMSGFYSKDLIIETSYGNYTFSGIVIFWISLLSALGTSLYSAKIIYYTFYSQPNSNYNSYIHVHEPPLIMGIPLIILAILSIFSGYLFRDLFVGLGSIYFENSMLILPNHLNIIESEFGFISVILKILPLIFSFLGYVILVILLEYLDLRIFPKIISFFNHRFYVEELINEYIVYNSFNLGYLSNKIMDRGIFEILGPQGFTFMLTNIRNYINLTETGKILDFAVYFIITLCIALIGLDFEYIILYILGLISYFNYNNRGYSLIVKTYY